MTTLEQLNLSQPLTDVYTAMETDLMMAIARQLAAGGEINATSEWRLKKLAEAGALSKETVKIIASYTGIQSELLTETIESAAVGVVSKLEPALQACARNGYISAVDSTPISTSTRNVVTNFHKQAKNDLNLVNTVMQYKAGSSYKNLVNKIYDDTKRQELLAVLGKHTLEVASGGTSSQEAVRNCIKEFAQKGIPAFVDKRGREWSPEAYISMDIRTTVHNTAHAAQDACCEKYGIDLIEIDSHMGARPKCALDQGKLFSRSNRSGVAHDGDGNEITFYPWSSSSYGQPDGILGINCHHHKYPFVDGVNFQTYYPYDKEENAERYKEFQKQRAMERRVRATSREADMLEAAGDPEGAKAARKKLREQRKEYLEYSKEHNLSVHNDRLTVTKVKNGDPSYKEVYKSALDKSAESGIIEARSINNMNIKIDKFTPCLEETQSGKIVQTSYSLATIKELSSLEGWNFNWTDESLKNSKVYKLTVSDSDEIQGLVALTDFKRNSAIYVNLAESAPHNIGKQKRYNGVGGHLFAIAVQKSVDCGYGGYVFMDAKNAELVDHYKKTLGAMFLGRPHPYRMIIDEENAMKLLSIYTLKGE